MSGKGPQNYAARGRARLDDIVTAERRLQLTVEAIEEYSDKIKEFESTLPRRGIKQPIDAGLGAVVIDGTGRLRDIQLNLERIGILGADSLGKRSCGR